MIFAINYLRNRNLIQIRKFSFYELNIKRKSHLTHIKRINIEDFIIIKRFIIDWKKNQTRAKKGILINYINDHIYRILLSNDRIIKSFKVIWYQKKNDVFFDFVFINHIKAPQHSTSYYFTIKKITPSPFKSFLFIKKMNINELIQFAKSFISIFINDNSENELISYTSQSLTSSSSTYILQNDTLSTLLQIETSS